MTQRFPRPPHWLLPCLLLATACGGGGGGPTDSVPPILVAAAFAGGATPTAGGFLVLTFSEPVRLYNATLADADFTWTPNGSLGTTPGAVSLADARQVQVTLGAGTTFVVDQTVIDIALANDTIADLAGNRPTPGSGAVISRSDGTAPTIARFTLNAIDSELNGTGPAGGILQVPENGWHVDLAYSDATGVDPAATVLFTNAAVTVGTALVPAGSNLLSHLTPTSVTATSARYTVPGDVVFPDGILTLSCLVVDLGGLVSATANLPIVVRHWTDARRPFETTVHPTQVWFLDTTRDIESFTVVPISGGASVRQVVDNNGVPITNGRSDFVDVLFALGLQTNVPLTNVIGTDDSNAVVLARIQTAILAQLALLFPGVKVQFTFTRPAGSFNGAPSFAYASFGYSQISVGGSAEATGVLGVAQLDPNNQYQNNDSGLEAAGRARLGVFLHTIADVGLGPPSTSSFRLDFSPFVAQLGGAAIGSQGTDRQRLLDTLNDARASQIDNAIVGIARFAAVVIAHECGHSMGLVIDGPMPNGLYGGDAVNFPGSTSGHIRNRSLFPAGSVNVMSPQLGYDSALDARTAFNSLNLAYLREQVSYGQ